MNKKKDASWIKEHIDKLVSGNEFLSWLHEPAILEEILSDPPENAAELDLLIKQLETEVLLPEEQCR